MEGVYNMPRRRYPGFFDQAQKENLAMMEHRIKEEEKNTELGKAVEKARKKIKRVPFVKCQDCEFYDPPAPGMFGCKVSHCIHMRTIDQILGRK
jgi:hypothetical protein